MNKCLLDLLNNDSLLLLHLQFDCTYIFLVLRSFVQFGLSLEVF